MPDQTRFSGWMVNYALCKHFEGQNGEEAKKWFFTLPVATSAGNSIVRETCGFDWLPGETECSCEKGLNRDDDRGTIEIEEFKKKYWGIRPDFRFWTKGKRAQLILEGKGNGDAKEGFPQAQRYFRYLEEFPSTGAVVYLVPIEYVQVWTEMLKGATNGREISFGVMCRSDPFLEKISNELVMAIAESLIGPAKLLERA